MGFPTHYLALHVRICHYTHYLALHVAICHYQGVTKAGDGENFVAED